MQNFFIIHGSFGSSKEHFLPWLTQQLSKKGKVICPSFPIGVNKQNFKSWAKELDKYKQEITKDTVFIARSIGPIFVIKYLIENNLKIDKLISISGFNNYSVDGGDYDKVNSTMFLNNLKDARNYIKNIICFISENDPYINFEALKSFSSSIADKIINIKDGGHFNADSGYGEKFVEILNSI